MKNFSKNKDSNFLETSILHEARPALIIFYHLADKESKTQQVKISLLLVKVELYTSKIELSNYS